MLTVVCLWVRGEVAYTADYVRRLERMVARWLDRPYRFVCLTDQPTALPAGIEARSVTRLPDCWALWTKVRLFDPVWQWPGRVLYLDLDTLVVASLGPIVDHPAPLALTADLLVEERAHLDRDRYGRQLRRRYNSSVMVWEGDGYADLWTAWTPAVAARLSTDQDWIAERHPEAAAMPAAWFPRIGRVQPPPWPAEAKVVLVKKPKPHEAVRRWPWFDALWGGAAA